MWRTIRLKAKEGRSLLAQADMQYAQAIARYNESQVNLPAAMSGSI